MISNKPTAWPSLLALGLALTVGGPADGQSAPPAATAPPKKTASKRAGPKTTPEEPPFQQGLEPKAIDILKASSARLAAAHSMSFTAVVTYESPSRHGHPLAYTTTSEVLVQRPDKLRVVTPADGPASEFYYDGKTMMALAPVEKLVAVAAAPPTLDDALKAAYDSAGIYYPFTDVIVADPYKDMAGGLELAYYIGQSHVVGGTTTDMLAYIDYGVFVQAWIGADDKLPREMRAIYLNDPLQMRHRLEMSNWKLDVDVPADAFGSPAAASAKRIPFTHPDALAPQDARAQMKGNPAQGQN